MPKELVKKAKKQVEKDKKNKKKVEQQGEAVPKIKKVKKSDFEQKQEEPAKVSPEVVAPVENK